jgi:hypothetical protein
MQSCWLVPGFWLSMVLSLLLLALLLLLFLAGAAVSMVDER